MHGIHSEMQRYIHQLEWRLTFEAWEVIVNSHHMHAELKRLFGVPSDKIVVIPNGTDPDVFDRYIHVMAADPAVKVHIYGKQVRPGRKIGHVTAIGDDPEDLADRARRAASYLRWGKEDGD